MITYKGVIVSLCKVPTMPDLTQAIYQQFSTSPVTPADDGLYINLDAARGHADIVCRLAQKIRLAGGQPTCQVLAGHKGSGKSTELLRLQKELESPIKSHSVKPFFVVYCKTDEDVDRNDVDFPDVLIALIRQVARQLRERCQIELKPSYFKSRWLDLKGLMTSEVSVESLDLDIGLGKLAAKIKSSPTAREEIRKLLEPNTNNWLDAANDVISEAALELSKKNYAGLVILVDDLDKMIVRPHLASGCSTAEYLFVNRSAQLTAFNCHVIYTIPLSLAYSCQEQTLKANYNGHVPVVPMTKIMTQPPASKPYDPGVKLFRDIIAARLNAAGAREQDLFANDVVRDELIHLSGGQPTALMSLVREAIIAHGLPITHQSLDRAKKEGQRDYTRQLLLDHWPIIEEIRNTGLFGRTKNNESTFRELLDSRAILQYVNDVEWYGLNPMVAALKPPPSIQGNP